MSVTYITDRSSAYASVNQYGFTTFNREAAYESMDYADVGYRLLSLLNSLFRTSNNSLKLTIEREGQVSDVTVPCDSVYHTPMIYSQPSHRLLDHNIGYINPASLAPGEITDIMTEFWNTKGIVIDLRTYPSDFIVFSLGNLLIPDNAVFAKGAFLNLAVPGEFRFISDLTVDGQGDKFYSGKVMILMDQRTQSMAEYTVMALRLAPGAKVVGSNSIGTDGDIVTFTLPGGISTCMTGWGVYTPDGTVTQRVGLKPDIYVEPTVEGIRKGQDEVLEMALEQIQ